MKSTRGKATFLAFMFWFAFANLLLAEVVACAYFYESGVLPSGPWAYLWSIFYFNGHLAMLIFAGFLILALPVWLLWRRDWHRWFAALMCSVAILLLFIDAKVFGQYRFHINWVVLDMLFHGHGQVISFTWQSWSIAGFIFLGLLGLEYTLSRFVDARAVHVGGRGRVIIAFYLFSLAALHLGHIYADAIFYSPITRINSVLPFSIPAQAQTFMGKHGFVDVAEYRRRNAMRAKESGGALHYPLGPLNCSTVARPMNILWIAIDALRADMITPEIMPNVFALGERSTVFDNHYSNSNTTRYGVFSMFYGIPGSYFKTAMEERQPPALIERLSELKFNFGVYGSAPLTKPEFDQTVFSLVPNLRVMSRATQESERDIEITDEMVKFVPSNVHETSSAPFFGFLFYDSCHSYTRPKDFDPPYLPEWDRNFLALNPSSDPVPVRNSYMNSARFIDGQIARVIATLKAHGMFEHTIILVTSDHGQEFNDNHEGYWGHNSNYSAAQTHVPLVLYWPGRRPMHVERRTQAYDIAPTLLRDAFKCAADDSVSSSGHNLFGQSNVPWVLMGREFDYAISRAHDIIVVKPTGDYEVVDSHYHHLDDVKLNDSDMLDITQAMGELSRFYK